MGKYKDNPWLGLESYQENQIIYGRNKEIEELSQCVLNNNETVLYGKSGIGKSSIINAGIIPVVRAHGYTPIVVRLDHSNKHSYIKQLADLIEKGANVSECSTAKPVEEQLLWEYFHTHRFNKNKEEKSKLVVIFDQFEEIFTLQNNATTKGQFFKELGDVLNNVMPKELIEEQPVENTESQSSATKQESVSGFADMADLFSSLAATVKNSASKYIEDNDIHFVFTLREDFLSEFEYHTSKIPSLKQHRYGLRPLNEEQAAEIILRPRPELVDEGVARIIIETVTNRTDFSLGDEPEIDVDAAVLSLFLSQIYDKRDTEDSLISVNLVKTFGKDIIKDFYEESIGELSPKQIDFLEEELLTGENRRDSLSRADFKAGGFSEAELKRLIDDKKLLRQFHYEGDLRVEFIHDILCPVVKERKEQREMLRQQEAERIRQEEEKRRLQEEAERKQREVEEKAAREKAELETEAIRIKKRNKKRLVSIAAMVFVATLGVIAYFVYDYYYNEYVFEDYYADYDNIKGWPTGNNPLSQDEASHTAKYYKLSYKGYKNRGHYTDVEVMSSNKYLGDNCRIPCLEWTNNEAIDAEAKAYNDILRQIVKIHYSGSEDGKSVSKEDYFDKNGELLMTKSYYHINSNDAYVQYMTPRGENMKIRKNGIDRVKVNWNNNGRVASMTYYDAKGVQKNIEIGTDVTGFLWDYSKEDTIVRYALNQFGIPSDNIKSNTEYHINRGDSSIIIFGNSVMVYQSQINEVTCERGYSREIKTANYTRLYNKDSNKQAIRKYEYDDYGNIKSVKTHGDYLFGFPEVVNYKYTDGRKIFEEHLCHSGKAYKNNVDGIYRWEYAYGENGNITEEKHYKYDGALIYHYKESSSKTGNIQVKVKSRLDLNDSIVYVERIDSIFPNGKSVISYYGENKSPINVPYNVGIDTMAVHKVVITDTPEKKIQEFYVSNEGHIVAMPTFLLDNYYALNYFRRTEEYDSEGNMTSLCIQDVDNNIIKNMIYYYQNGTRIGRAARSIIDGGPVRCDRWEEEGFCYYKLYYSKNYEDVYYAVHTVDEWNNRSSFFNGSMYLTGENKQFKNDPSAPMEFFNSYEQYCFYKDPEMSNVGVPFIHLLSANSSLYNNGKGLHDGDRIIKLGEWHIGMNESEFMNVWSNIFSKSKILECSILRFMPSGYKQVEMNLPIKTSDIDAVEYHFIKLTNKEKDYILPYIK